MRSMSELSTVNVEKLIHSFVRHLTFQVSPVCNKKWSKINFTSYIDDAHRLNPESPRNDEKSRNKAMRGILDITDVQNIRHFMETQTKFLDKFVYSKDIPLLAHHFSCINNEIVQNVQKDINQMNRNAKEHKTKYYEPSKLEQIAVRRKRKDLSSVQTKKSVACTTKRNLTRSIAEYAKREIELNEKYLRLYINNVEFMKRNVHVTLYVDTKVI